MYQTCTIGAPRSQNELCARQAMHAYVCSVLPPLASRGDNAYAGEQAGAPFEVSPSSGPGSCQHIWGQFVSRLALVFVFCPA